MKKILSLIIVMLVISFHSYGQIYTSIEYLDKFDDTIKKETVKTLITRTDSTFVVETKGRTPQTYHIFMKQISRNIGTKDNPTNLVANVYGYQECWYVMKAMDYKEWCMRGDVPANRYLLTIVYRVITTQYTHDYRNEYFWIESTENKPVAPGVDRIIYRTD